MDKRGLDTVEILDILDVNVWHRYHCRIVYVKTIKVTSNFFKKKTRKIHLRNIDFSRASLKKCDKMNKITSNLIRGFGF